MLEAEPALGRRPQGYRLHLDRRGLEALRSLLPTRAVELVEATCGQFAEPRRLRSPPVGRPLQAGRDRADRVDGRLVSTAADRGTLRAILTAVGGGGRRPDPLGQRVSGFRDDGELVQVHTAAGADVPADVLVGATARAPAFGRNDCPSCGRRQRARQHRRPKPGQRGLARASWRRSSRYVVLRGPRTGVGLGLLRFTDPPDRAGAAAGVPLTAVDDYVMWNVGSRRGPTSKAPGQSCCTTTPYAGCALGTATYATLVAAAEPDRTLRLQVCERSDRPPGRRPGHRARRCRPCDAARPRLGSEPGARGCGPPRHRRCRGCQPTT